jgi:ADP-ribose pyrophosphatase YjhB (NUDIX family)
MDIGVKIGVVITDKADNKILLIKEKYKKKDRPLWNIVKGTYGDNGNESIFDTAIRECREEVSVKVELTGALGVYISKEEDRMRIQFNFLGKIVEGEPKVAPMNEQESRDEYIQEVKWFTKDEIANLSQDEFISNRIYELVHDWMSGKKFPSEVYKQVSL